MCHYRARDKHVYLGLDVFMYTHLKPSIFKISGEKSIAELALYNALTFRGSYLRCNVIGQSIRNQLLIIHETGLGGRCLHTRSAIERVHV